MISGSDKPWKKKQSISFWGDLNLDLLFFPLFSIVEYGVRAKTHTDAHNITNRLHHLPILHYVSKLHCVPEMSHFLTVTHPPVLISLWIALSFWCDGITLSDYIRKKDIFATRLQHFSSGNYGCLWREPFGYSKHSKMMALSLTPASCHQANIF